MKTKLLNTIKLISNQLEQLKIEIETNIKDEVAPKSVKVKDLSDPAKKWIKALRSGNYTQGKSTLKTHKGHYCCLGVACIIAKQEGIIDRNLRLIEEIYLDEDNAELNKVREWIGLSTGEGDYENEDGEEITLTKLNDQLEYDFKKIADVIESNPKGLFN